jgi:hypothetical protein
MRQVDVLQAEYPNMCRRIFTILMLLLVPMNSSAMFAHGHGDFLGHPTQPHIHTHEGHSDHKHGSCSTSHGHVHRHSGNSYVGHEASERSQSQSRPLELLDNMPVEHDSDAIYLEVDKVVAAERSSIDFSLQFSWVASLDAIRIGSGCKTLQKIFEWEVLRIEISATPLYVRQCALLI